MKNILAPLLLSHLLLGQLAGLLLLLSGCLHSSDTPEPVPDPVPVVPVTPVVPGPLKVLVLYEGDDFPRLPPSQVAAIQSQTVRAWLTTHRAEYRIWDQHVDTTHAPEFWQRAVQLPHDSLPWIWISGEGKGVNGPLPQTVDGVIELLDSVKPDGPHAKARRREEEGREEGGQGRNMEAAAHPSPSRLRAFA